MKRTLLGFFATLAVAFLPNARVALGQEISFASHAEIMSVLEQQNQRIAELEGSSHGGGSGCTSCGSSCCDSCDSCCDGCCDPCCRPGGIIGSVELTFLKPHNSMGNRGVSGAPVEFGYEMAPRITAGYQGSDGLGWRVRYWEFNHTATVNIGGGVTDSQNYDTYVLDLEFVDSMSLGCYWDATFFAGFRYVEFDEERAARAANGVILGFNSFDTAGYGLTVGGELRRCIGNNLAGFVNVRSSVIMGDESEYSFPVGPGNVIDNELDNIYYMWEAQAGVQWTQELEMGGYLFARVAGEVQFWDNFVGEPGFDGGESVGFGGLSIATGIIR